MRLTLPARTNRIQSILILAVFCVFAINALGVVDFSGLPRGEVDFNAQVVGELLHGRGLTPFSHIDVMAFMVVGLLLALLLPSLSPVGASLLTLAAMFPPFYAAWFFPVPPPLIPLEYTLLTVLVLFSVNVLSSYFVETHQRQKIIDVFGQYVPPALVGEISQRPEAYSMATEARELSVLFCDVKGFTTIAEQLEPQVLAELLNRYLSAMTEVLHEHGATIDKYIGDAIMAFWGAPVPQADHAERAIAAALDMQARMAAVRATCGEEGWPELEIGIGIATGMMNVGNMGSRYRVAYTVIGDAVNLAARLEALTRLYGVGILASASTHDAVPGRAWREIDHVRVKGKADAARIFEPLDSERAAHVDIAAHASGLEAYYRGDWQAAKAVFQDAGAALPDDRYIAMLLERMSSTEPPEGWDGVLSFGGELSYSLVAPGASAERS